MGLVGQLGRTGHRRYLCRYLRGCNSHVTSVTSVMVAAGPLPSANLGLKQPRSLFTPQIRKKIRNLCLLWGVKNCGSCIDAIYTHIARFISTIKSGCACPVVLGFLRFDPSPEICSQTSSYSTSHWAHGPSGWWCIELRLHQMLQKSIRNRYLKVAPFEPPFKTILETNLLT